MAIDFKTRLHITAAGIDFLLNHPNLRPADVLAGVMILRQTVLFGKLSDTMTLNRLSRGVPHLNRGTGYCRRRLSLAVARLAKVQFVRIEKAQSSWQGRMFTLLCEAILPAVKAMRRPAEEPSSRPERDDTDSGSAEVGRKRQSRVESIASGARECASSESAAAMRRLVGQDDVEQLRQMLNEMTSALRVRLPEVDQSTCRNLIAGARQVVPDATPLDIVWFLRNKLVDSPTRFRTWGGAVVTVRCEFGRERR